MRMRLLFCFLVSLALVSSGFSRISARRYPAGPPASFSHQAMTLPPITFRMSAGVLTLGGVVLAFSSFREFAALPIYQSPARAYANSKRDDFPLTPLPDELKPYWTASISHNGHIVTEIMVDSAGHSLQFILAAGDARLYEWLGGELIRRFPKLAGSVAVDLASGWNIAPSRGLLSSGLAKESSMMDSEFPPTFASPDSILNGKIKLLAGDMFSLQPNLFGGEAPGIMLLNRLSFREDRAIHSKPSEKWFFNFPSWAQDDLYRSIAQTLCPGGLLIVRTEGDAKALWDEKARLEQFGFNVVFAVQEGDYMLVVGRQSISLPLLGFLKKHGITLKWVSGEEAQASDRFRDDPSIGSSAPLNKHAAALESDEGSIVLAWPHPHVGEITVSIARMVGKILSKRLALEDKIHSLPADVGDPIIWDITTLGAFGLHFGSFPKQSITLARGKWQIDAYRRGQAFADFVGKYLPKAIASWLIHRDVFSSECPTTATFFSETLSAA